MKMKKINLEIIAPEEMSLETLYEVLFKKGLSNTRLGDGNGGVFELEMSQVTGNLNTVVLTTKKVNSLEDVAENSYIDAFEHPSCAETEMS